jgi:cysteinyl-tRNA synthetase
MAEAERRFEQAASAGDTAQMVTAVLDLESAAADWEDDTDEDQGPEQARALLRTLIARLARPEPPTLRAMVEPLLGLRATLRDQRRYDEADVIRDALAAAGLDIRDTPDGTWWQP